MSLLDEVLHAHGGPHAWRRVRWVRTSLRFGGLAFTMRLNGAGQRSRQIAVAAEQPMTVFEDYPSPGRRGVFGPERVAVEGADGKALTERMAPRAAFGSVRRSLWWDDLDLLYFAGYATWNYFTAPFLLALPGVQVAEGEPWREAGEVWRRLEVTFPAGFPTHSTRQTYYVDRTLRVRRLDYTASVFASWAAAAHYCFDHVTVDGIAFPTRRRVVPRAGDGRSRSGPILVWIESPTIRLERRVTAQRGPAER